MRTAARRLIALIVVSALATMLAAAPAAAYGSLGGLAASCGFGHEPPVPGFEGRSDKVREKDLAQTHGDMPASAKGKAPASMTATVPVYFHVITDGSLGNLTNGQISAQIGVLNDTFGGGEGGDDTGFGFSLAGVTRTNNATWYASRSGGAEHAMKQALKQDGPDALNVYSTSGGAYLGWAYLPEIVDTAQAYLDGVVIDWRTVPRASDEYEGQYDQGETLTHEVGHWLNLEHTFYGGCNKGDFVADTPPQKNPSFGCPEGKDTCRAPGLDPIHNYMDYSDDPCLSEFTPGQSQRMGDAWLFYRVG
jgi:hypothetical protein